MLKNNHLQCQSGYIALTSILIIALLVVFILAAISFLNYFSSQNLLSIQHKDQSSSAAIACLNIARSNIFAEFNYSPINFEVYLERIGECKILSVLPATGFPKTIILQGRYPPKKNTQAVTNLLVIINSVNKIIKWNEY